MNMIKWTVVFAGVASAVASTGCSCPRCGNGCNWWGGPAAPAYPATYPPAAPMYPGPASYSVPAGSVPGPVSASATPISPTANQYPAASVPTATTPYK